MSNEYLCKVCRGHLKVKSSIVLSATKLTDRTQKGLVFLNSELGNYTTTTHPSFTVNKGEEYIYNCPICGAQLNSVKYLHLVRIIMIDEKGKEYNIYFSGIAGEEATIKVKDDKVEEEKGHDVKAYSKYFDIPEEDRKYL